MILNILMLVKFFILSFQMAGSIQMIIVLLSNSFEYRAYQLREILRKILHGVKTKIRLNQSVPEITLMFFV